MLQLQRIFNKETVAMVVSVLQLTATVENNETSSSTCVLHVVD
jgi:hypothetical protein